MLLAPSLVHSMEEAPIIGNWGFLVSKESSLQGVLARNNWEGTELPFILNPGKTIGKSSHYLWLRGSFYMAKNGKESIGIYLSNIRLGDTVFINGFKIGNRESHEAQYIYMPRGYKISHSFLRYGNNEIFIRLSINEFEFAGITENVSLISENLLHTRKNRNNLLYNLFPFSILIFFMIATIIMLIFFFHDFKNTTILTFAGTLFFYGIHIVANYSPIGITNHFLKSAIYFTSAPLLGIILLILFQKVFGFILAQYNRIILPSLMGIVVLTLFNLFLIKSYPIFIFQNFITIILISISFLLFLSFLKKKMRNKFPIHILFISLLFIILIIMKSLSDSFLISKSDIFIVYGSLIMILSLSFFIIREMMNRQRNILHLYSSLKQVKKEDIAITESSEIKLKEIISFIQNNYRADISREGLAHAVGISPNYMSTLFTNYTGDKISTFIKKLRIEEAKQKLHDDSETVLEIAFSVGFESLSTFNRAFKNVTGKTPTEFKQELQK